jgi:hypothetical protein
VSGASRNGFAGIALAAALLLISSGTVVWASPGHRQHHGRMDRRRATSNTTPTVSIASPVNGATYTQGQQVASAYSCTAPAQAHVTACAGPVPSGAPVPTTGLGQHAFTVDARASDGGTATRTIVYIVAAGAASPQSSAALPPTISAIAQSAQEWREGNELAQISREKLPVGTTFSFSLNEQAAVTFSFVRSARARCRRGAGIHARGSTCARNALQGSFAFTGREGANTVAFQGVISPSKKLGPGSYTVVVGATNVAGAHARPESLSFDIVR